MKRATGPQPTLVGQLDDGTALVLTPDGSIPPWAQTILARRGRTAALSSRQLKRELARTLRKQAKR